MRQTLAQIALAKRQLTDAGIPFTDAEVGAMVEIPATAIMILFLFVGEGILQLFGVDVASFAVAGSLVIEGTVKRNKPIRVLRNSVVVFEGELESLRRFKDIVEEVRSGTECGIAVKAYDDVKPGDQIECFERIEVARSL